MYPWKTIINIDKGANAPVYLQIAQAIIQEINQGRLRPGQRLPSTRALASLLGINRKTLVIAYEELMAQGWLEILPYKGTFVSKKLPRMKYRNIPKPNKSGKCPERKGLPAFPTDSRLKVLTMPKPGKGHLIMDGGAPDERLAPMDLIYKKCRSICHLPKRDYLSYAEVEGEGHLRRVLSDYLGDTRGLSCESSSIFITRGSQMAIFLIFNILLKEGGAAIVGEKSYPEADDVIRQAGGTLLKAAVDEQGIVAEDIETLCESHPVKGIYITPHHHYPTTVTLSAQRRIQLLDLAEQYGFFILEDDYDYDFHYKSSPLLPLASLDNQGYVIYIGGFSKLLAPAVRIGYVVCPREMVLELNKLRQLVDRQGDPMMERAIAEIIEEGELQRHLKKTLKTYRLRRDLFCSLLKKSLGDHLDFTTPDGGMAVWLRFRPHVPLPKVLGALPAHGLHIRFEKDFPEQYNALRLGFASLEEEEIQTALRIFSSTLKAHLPPGIPDGSFPPVTDNR